MSNSFNISVAPEVAAVQAVVDANSVIITDIHDTDLPDVHTDIATIDTEVDAIRAIDLPNQMTQSVANAALIAIVDGVADDIKLKTDALPQNVRSKWLAAMLTTGEDTWQTVVDVTGAGILYGINETHTGGETGELRLTLDSVVWTVLNSVDSMQFVMPSFGNVSGNLLLPAANPPVELFRFEFWENMKVEIREEPGKSGAYNCKVHYSIDQF